MVDNVDFPGPGNPRRKILYTSNVDNVDFHGFILVFHFSRTCLLILTS